MPRNKNAFFAIGINLVKLVLDPEHSFTAVISLVGIKCGVGVYINSNKINAVYNVVKCT